jgi:hypothetical protein
MDYLSVVLLILSLMLRFLQLLCTGFCDDSGGGSRAGSNREIGIRGPSVLFGKRPTASECPAFDKFQKNAGPCIDTVRGYSRMVWCK